MKFAENLKRIRKEKNLSQEEVGEIMTVSRQSVSKYEQGKTYPEIEKLMLLSKEFNITIDGLISDYELNAVDEDNKSHEKEEKTNTENDDFMSSLERSITVIISSAIIIGVLIMFFACYDQFCELWTNFGRNLFHLFNK